MSTTTTPRQFVGRCEQVQTPFNTTEVKIGFSATDIAKLQEFLNDKGWVNCYLKTSKEGKPFMEIFQKSAAPAAKAPAEDLPF